MSALKRGRLLSNCAAQRRRCVPAASWLCSCLPFRRCDVSRASRGLKFCRRPSTRLDRPSAAQWLAQDIRREEGLAMSESNGAEGGTRTPTVLLPPAPQASGFAMVARIDAYPADGCWAGACCSGRTRQLYSHKFAHAADSTAGASRGRRRTFTLFRPFRKGQATSLISSAPPPS